MRGRSREALSPLVSFAQEPKPLPRITLITLIYTDLESSIRSIFKFVNPYIRSEIYFCGKPPLVRFLGLGTPKEARFQGVGRVTKVTISHRKQWYNSAL